jgi:hypothetical protein
VAPKILAPRVSPHSLELKMSTSFTRTGLFVLAAGSLLCLLSSAAWSQSAQQHDGSHDFDFLIGDWRAHVKRLPDRLVGSNAWIEYDGISRHKKILDSNANFEEFEVDT